MKILLVIIHPFHLQSQPGEFVVIVDREGMGQAAAYLFSWFLVFG